jgi:hypothetical protein
MHARLSRQPIAAIVAKSGAPSRAAKSPWVIQRDVLTTLQLVADMPAR